MSMQSFLHRFHNRFVHLELKGWYGFDRSESFDDVVETFGVLHFPKLLTSFATPEFYTFRNS